MGKKPKKILIVGTQGRSVSSGPGTFMRYLSEGISEGKLNAEIIYPHSKNGTFMGDREFIHFIPNADRFYNSFWGSWIIVSLFVYLFIKSKRRYKQYREILFADRFSALFAVIDPKIKCNCLSMINDDTRILEYKHFKESKQVGARSRSAFFFYFEKFILRNSNRVVTNSEYLTALVSEAYFVNRRKIDLLYKAVDLEKFRSVCLSDELHNPVRVLFVKNEWHRGGLDTLIQALSGLTDIRFRLDIIGISSEAGKTKINSIVEEAGFHGEVVHHGLVDRHEIPTFFLESDIFCVPSRKEALGVAFLEALATGTPVIATRVGGIPEVLKHGEAGMLVPPDSPSELASAIREMIQDRETRQRKVQVGLEHVKSFSSSRMFQRIGELSTV